MNIGLQCESHRKMRNIKTCASGFEAWGTFEAWGPGLEDLEVSAAAAFGIVQRRTEFREAWATADSPALILPFSPGPTETVMAVTYSSWPVGFCSFCKLPR